MGTKPAKPKQPAPTKIEQGATVGDLLKGAAKVNSAPAKAVTEEDVIAFLEMQQKGSDLLKKARNVVWRKIAAKEAKPELVEVFRQAVQLHGFADCKLAWNVIRKENAKTEAKEEESAE